MKVAKIVSSNSHISYVARILEERDGLGVPAADEYGFGRFVKIDVDDDSIIGVICDSRLVNPEYSNFSPRLAQMPALGDLRRELMDEQKALVGILLLGWRTAGETFQEIPKRVVPAGQMVESMGIKEVIEFHRPNSGEIRMQYFPSLMNQAGSLSIPLAKTMIKQLEPHFSEAEQKRLSVMTASLDWKHAFGENRF